MTGDGGGRYLLEAGWSERASLWSEGSLQMLVRVKAGGRGNSKSKCWEGGRSQILEALNAAVKE